MELIFFLLLPFIIAVAWITVFLLNRRYLRLHDRIAILLLGCSAMTCYIVMRSLLVGTCDYLYILFDNIETVLGLSICPLSFLYMRLVARDSHWRWWYCLLLIPGVIIGLAGTALSISVGWDRILEVRGENYAPFLPNPDSQMEILYRFVNITLFNITLEVMAVVLIGWSIFYLMRYYKRIGNYYADLEDSSIGRMQRFLISTIVLLLTIFTITTFITDIEQGSSMLIVISAWLSILSWNVCYNSYNIRLTERNLNIIDDGVDSHDVAEMAWTHFDSQYSLSRQPEDVIGEKISRWQTNELKPFCREGITINDAASEMNVNPRELSEYINKHYGVNFNRWINTLRIEEAKRLLTQLDDAKISYVSAKCGFPNPGALSRAFRMIEGCSPTEFQTK